MIFKPTHLVGYIFMLFFLGACGSLPTMVHNTPDEVDVTDEISKGTEQAYHPSPQFGEVKLEVNPAVQKWLNYFQGRGRRHMLRYMKRSTRYVPMMKKELRQRGMPEELVFVPLIESGFNHKAHSYASAVGYWQFIRPTGKRYGLEINTYVDERKDPMLSTKAAAEYFSALYNLFGDWYLALASYNTGENRVKRAVMKYRTRNFWRLAKRRRLPRETRNYVPKFIAAALIYQNPAKYGFTDIDYQEAMSFDKISVSRSISLLTLSKNLNVPFEDLKKLNPKYRSDYVPVKFGESELIRVPKGMGVVALEAVSNSYASGPLTKFSKGYVYHRIRRGDTLSGIAVRYRTRVRTLRALNGLSRRSLLRVGRRLKIPERGGFVAQTKQPSKKKSYKRRTINSSSNVHVVRRGENLSTIARKYGTSVYQLKKYNGLGRRSLLRVGQRLNIRGEHRVHVVRRGENLSAIAKKYGITVRMIAQANSLRNRSRIFAGKTLIIPE